MSEYGPEDGITVACEKPRGGYCIPEFLSAIDAVYCNYMAWAISEDESKLADALTMYVKHKKEDFI